MLSFFVCFLVIETDLYQVSLNYSYYMITPVVAIGKGRIDGKDLHISSVKHHSIRAS